MTFGSLFHLQMVMAYFHTFSSNKGVYLWCIDFKYFISFFWVNRAFIFQDFELWLQYKIALYFFLYFLRTQKIICEQNNILGLTLYFLVDVIFPKKFCCGTNMKSGGNIIIVHHIILSSIYCLLCSKKEKRTPT